MVESGGRGAGNRSCLPHRAEEDVLVHKFICRGTVEEKIDALIEEKLGLSGEIVDGGGEALLTEMSDAALLELVALDLRTAVADG